MLPGYERISDKPMWCGRSFSGRKNCRARLSMLGVLCQAPRIRRLLYLAPAGIQDQKSCLNPMYIYTRALWKIGRLKANTICDFAPQKLLLDARGGILTWLGRPRFNNICMNFNIQCLTHDRLVMSSLQNPAPCLHNTQPTDSTNLAESPSGD